MSQTNKFDVIVIGSGMGGMTAASLLAGQFGKKVLIIEKHYTFGGLTHEFSRRNSSWDVGLHYLGDLEPGSLGRKLFDAVTAYQIQMNKMPDNYDNAIFANYEFSIPSNPLEYQNRLIHEFPEEARAIKRYFKHINSYRWLLNFVVTRHFLPLLLRPVLDLVELIYTKVIGINKLDTTNDYLAKHFKSKRLKSILLMQWGDYGVLPDKSAMLVHATIACHYLNGGYYPQNGAKSIGDAVASVLTMNKGEILLNNAVKKIILDQGRAIGVETEKNTPYGGKQIFADVIISNVGADLTYTQLLPTSGFKLSQSKLDVLAKLENTDNFLTLYLALNKSPESLGFDGGNIWYFTSENHKDNLVKIADDKFPALLYISFPTLKGHIASCHTMEIITIVPFADFKQWDDTQWMNRGTEYEAFKEQIINKIINKVDKLYPGFRATIDYVELATPLTIKNFTSRKFGNTYGLRFTPERVKNKWINARTPIKNLYLSGQDVVAPGVFGAMFGGVCAAGLALNQYSGFSKIVASVTKLAKNKDQIAKIQSFSKHLVISQVIDETPEAYTLVFDNPGIKFYETGQYINICIPIENKLHYRSYSLTSVPSEIEKLSITIKRVGKGIISNYIKDNLKVGDKIEFEGPLGDFVWPLDANNQNHYLMIGGGSGITPIYAHIKSILEFEPKSRITLLFANKTIVQAIFKDKFEQFLAKYGDRFKLVYFLSQEHQGFAINGRVTQDYLAEVLSNNKIDYTFVCTPKSMNNSIKDMFSNLNYPNERLFLEKFTFGSFINEVK